MNTYSTKKIESAIKKVIHYYHFFNYSPSFDLIYTFFPYQILKKELQIALNHMVKNNELISHVPTKQNYTLESPIKILNSTYPSKSEGRRKKFIILDSYLYTLPQYSILIKKRKKLEDRMKNKNRLLEKVKSYIHLLNIMPFIQMVTITGSASMGNCKKNDDIDLCIVTKMKSLWITRFICIVLAKMMGLYAKYVCLNLFFDESDLIIPKQKQTIYIGHELLQMKLVINKNKTYERMLLENKWVFTLFPNSNGKIQKTKIKINSQKSNVTQYALIIKRLIDTIFRTIQLPLIHKNKTFLLITNTQLWLFKKDFEKKL